MSVSAGADSGYVSGLPTIEHVKDVLFLPDRTSPSDNDTIKNAVLQYGAVYTAMYADEGMASNATSDYYNPSTSAYYYYDSSPADHAVDIVGWDDSYPRADFSTDPSMDGAFICRNSWGTGFGDQSSPSTQGYFYVSYADVLIGTSMAVFTGEPTTDYAQNLGHDTLGFTDNYGYGSDTAWMAAGYTVKGASSLEAVGLYALSPGTSYTLYIGSSLTDRATWTSVGSGTTDTAGYFTLGIAPQNVVAGVKFYVIAELTAPGTGTKIGGPIPLEDYEPDYSSKAASAPGQSYVSSDGSQWTDLDVAYPTYSPDVCLKVFAGAATPDTSQAGHEGAGRGQRRARALRQPALPRQRRDRQARHREGRDPHPHARRQARQDDRGGQQAAQRLAVVPLPLQAGARLLSLLRLCHRPLGQRPVVGRPGRAHGQVVPPGSHATPAPTRRGAAPASLREPPLVCHRRAAGRRAGRAPSHCVVVGVAAWSQFAVPVPGVAELAAVVVVDAELDA